MIAGTFDPPAVACADDGRTIVIDVAALLDLVGLPNTPATRADLVAEIEWAAADLGGRLGIACEDDVREECDP